MKSMQQKLIRLSWFVTYGTRQWLDDRGRIQDHKCYMTESQAKYFETKHVCCQAVHEVRWEDATR